MIHDTFRRTAAIVVSRANDLVGFITGREDAFSTNRHTCDAPILRDCSRLIIMHFFETGYILFNLDEEQGR